MLCRLLFDPFIPQISCNCLKRVIALFRSLFRGREDVYARRWESSKTGKSGYQPDCKNDWIYSTLINDVKRNQLILQDIIQAIEEKRSPVVITERKEHLCFFEEALLKITPNTIVLKGGMGSKHRKAVMEKIAAIAEDEPRVLIATGRYLGEGFDDARLDTLFLTMPISWEGTLAQYAGRLHREHHNKTEVLIYDYVDELIPVLMRMWEKREKSYGALGYVIDDSSKSSQGLNFPAIF